MITNCDLDVKNYCDKELKDDETIIYLRADKKDCTHILMGDVTEMVNMLLDCEDLHDVLLNSAAFLVREKKLDFDEILKFVTDENK